MAMTQCEINSFLLDRELELLEETQDEIPSYEIRSLADYNRCIDESMLRVDRIQAQAQRELEEQLILEDAISWRR